MKRAALDAHTQLCRCCDALKPAAEFGPGDSFCVMCRGLIGPMMQNGRPTSTDARLAAPVSFSKVKAQVAATKHAAALDKALAGIFSDGGIWAVQLGTAEAMKRLALSRRDELTRQGWIV